MPKCALTDEIYEIKLIYILLTHQPVCRRQHFRAQNIRTLWPIYNVKQTKIQNKPESKNEYNKNELFMYIRYRIVRYEYTLHWQT